MRFPVIFAMRNAAVEEIAAGGMPAATFAASVDVLQQSTEPRVCVTIIGNRDIDHPQAVLPRRFRPCPDGQAAHRCEVIRVGRHRKHDLEYFDGASVFGQFLEEPGKFLLVLRPPTACRGLRSRK